MASHQYCSPSVSCRCCTRCSHCTQLYNRGIVNLFHSWICPFLSIHFVGVLLAPTVYPCIDFLRNIRTSVEQVTIQDCNSSHRRVLSNRQQWFAHRRLNTSNYEIDSQSLARLDKFSSCCAESEVNIARNPHPVRDTLEPCRLSCTCVDSNLDPSRLSHFTSISVEITQVESTDFTVWCSICWFRQVKIVSVRCILGFVLSFRTTFVGVLLAPTVFR